MEPVFRIWKTSVEMADDLGEKHTTVRSWRNRGSIPADRDLRIVAAARARGYALTTDHLALLRSGVRSIVIPKSDVGRATQDATPGAEISADQGAAA